VLNLTISFKIKKLRKNKKGYTYVLGQVQNEAVSKVKAAPFFRGGGDVSIKRKNIEAKI